MTCEFWFLETKTKMSSYKYEITTQIIILIKIGLFWYSDPYKGPESQFKFWKILNFRCLSDRFLYSLSCLNFRWLVRPILKKRIHFAKRMLDWDAVLFVQGQFHITNITRTSHEHFLI